MDKTRVLRRALELTFREKAYGMTQKKMVKKAKSPFSSTTTSGFLCYCSVLHS
jgi:hypothetical protein